MQADRHSRLISWLKVALPLAALGLLSTMFLLSRSVDPNQTIPFADKEIQDRLRDQQVTGPFFSGTTANGDEITFEAERLITPAGHTGTNKAVDVQLRIRMQDGTQIALLAATSEFDLARDMAALSGDVIISTSTGYDITSQRITARISAIDVISEGPVKAKTPGGHLTAGAMRIHSLQENAPAQLFFTSGVKLLYQPQKAKE